MLEPFSSGSTPRYTSASSHFADELAIVMPLNWEVYITQFHISPNFVPVFGQIDTLSLHALRQSKSNGRRNVGKSICESSIFSEDFRITISHQTFLGSDSLW